LASAAGQERQLEIADLYFATQIAMGWIESRLHRFVIHGKEYDIVQLGSICFDDDPHEVRLGDFGSSSTNAFSITAFVVAAQDLPQAGAGMSKDDVGIPVPATESPLGGGQPFPCFVVPGLKLLSKRVQLKIIQIGDGPGTSLRKCQIVSTGGNERCI